MRGTIALFLLIFSLCSTYAACIKSGGSDWKEAIPAGDTTTQKMKITIGASIFHATLADNAAAKAFQALLPLTVSMTELNGNEKYFDLPDNLPVSAVSPGTLRNGDLQLWGSKTVVLFYKTFLSSYKYTKIGVINNPQGLETAVGNGNVTVSFENDQH